MSLFEKAIEVSISNLELAGCTYTVCLPDGSVRSNAKERKVRQQVVPRGTYSSVYVPKLQGLPDGGLAVIEVPEGIDAEGLRASACGWAHKHFGPGAMTTQIDGNKLICLRQ